MAQQTAVEFYDQALRKCLMGTVECDPMQILEQAKALEKDHLEDCWIASRQSEDSQTFFNYYNETYNK